jgi:hypothetical protein
VLLKRKWTDSGNSQEKVFALICAKSLKTYKNILNLVDICFSLTEQ